MLFLVAPHPEAFQSLTRDSNHSNIEMVRDYDKRFVFQSLTRDSNHSNLPGRSQSPGRGCFNPSRGIAIIQTSNACGETSSGCGFNPSRGIAIIQTRGGAGDVLRRGVVSIPHAG